MLVIKLISLFCMILSVGFIGAAYLEDGEDEQ